MTDESRVAGIAASRTMRRFHEAGYRPDLVENKAHQFIVLSGCSGGGKSTLLAELGRRGFAIFAEPGRQIVKEQLYVGGDGVPWGDAMKFVDLAVSRSMHNLIVAAQSDRVSFFDRGIVDQLGGLEHLHLPIPGYLINAVKRYRYRRIVFFVPPWKDVFSNDEERRHSFEDAVASYEPLRRTYERLGYEVVEVPKLGIPARADFVLERIDPGA